LKIFATENSIREFLREAMSGTGVGWPYAADMSEKPIGANPVVDPSAAVTDPDNEKFKPRNRTEFKIAVQSLVDDTADGDAPTLYDAVCDALQGFTKDEDEMKNKGVVKSGGGKVEETVRLSIKKMLAEMYGKINEAQAWKVSYFIPNKRGRAQPEKFSRTFTTEVEARAEAASAERRYGDINDVVTVEPVEMTALRAPPQITKIPPNVAGKDPGAFKVSGKSKLAFTQEEPEEEEEEAELRAYMAGEKPARDIAQDLGMGESLVAKDYNVSYLKTLNHVRAALGIPKSEWPKGTDAYKLRPEESKKLKKLLTKKIGRNPTVEDWFDLISRDLAKDETSLDLDYADELALEDYVAFLKIGLDEEEDEQDVARLDSMIQKLDRGDVKGAFNDANSFRLSYQEFSKPYRDAVDTVKFQDVYEEGEETPAFKAWRSSIKAKAVKAALDAHETTEKVDQATTEKAEKAVEKDAEKAKKAATAAGKSSQTEGRTLKEIYANRKKFRR
jgi:hypothetical protein